MAENNKSRLARLDPAVAEIAGNDLLRACGLLIDGRYRWRVRAELAEARAESLQSQLAAAQEDAKRLDYLDRIVKDGACPGLINDDAGHWAVSHCGIQNVPDSTPADISTTFFVMASEWKNSVREAIDADIAAAQTGESS